VVNNAVHAVLQGYDGAENLEALVVGSICGSCFKHDKPEAQHLIEYFHRLPDQVFADKATGALDLFEVIRHNLRHLGVRDEHIRRAGPCTFETDGLSSYREARTNLRNTVILVLQ
jgi:copper oxidase (laccase) domain-containing protein